VEPEYEVNWSRNYRYRGRLSRPRSVNALREVISSSQKVGFLGSRHSFNAIAVVEGVLLPLGARPHWDKLSLAESSCPAVLHGKRSRETLSRGCHRVVHGELLDVRRPFKLNASRLNSRLDM
jgi:hypothetical protein